MTTKSSQRPSGWQSSCLPKRQQSMQQIGKYTHTPLPLPRCNLCGFFSKTASTPRQQGSAECGKFAEKRHQAFSKKAAGNGSESIFQCQWGKDWQGVGVQVSWKDPRRNWWWWTCRQPTAHQSSRARWGSIAKILTIDGASPRVMGYFYKAIIQTVLLYWSELWTLTGRMIGRLRGLHHQVARYITGRHIKELEDGTYFCPHMKEVLNAAGMETI